MHPPIILHTLSIFKQMQKNLPPLVPEELEQLLEEKLREMQENHEITTEELEKAMIELGKELWPYSQAFEAMYRVYEGDLAEKLFKQRASLELRKEVQKRLDSGMNFRNLYAGVEAHTLDLEKRQEMTELFVDLRNEIREHVRQAVLSHEKGRYEDQIYKYSDLLKEIVKNIKELRVFAEALEHKLFAANILEHIRGIEHGFAWLAPQINWQEIRKLKEHYEEKLKELKYLR